MHVEIFPPTAIELANPSMGGALIIRGGVAYPGVVQKVEVFFDGIAASVQLKGNLWMAYATVTKSGNMTITAKARAFDTESPFASLTVEVPPTQWQVPTKVMVDDPPVDAHNVTVKVGLLGKRLNVLVDPAQRRKSIEVLIHINAYTNVASLIPPDLGLWHGQIVLPAAQVPYWGKLFVREYDFFNQFNDWEATDYNFLTADYTPPTIVITEPKEDHVFVVSSASFPFEVTVQGSVIDIQSHYKDGTLKYSFAAQNDIAVTPDINGLFSFPISVTGYGRYTLAITAEDKSGNKTPPVECQFQLVSSYKPKTIEELLAPRSYLDALLSFIRGHILDQDNLAVDVNILKDKFFLDFGKIAEPGSQVGSRTVNDLLMPVALLLKSRLARTMGLIARFTFDKPDTPTQFADEGPHRLGEGVLKDGAKFSDSTTGIGTIEFDGTGYAAVGGWPELKVGDNDRDFSVSFWIYVRDAGQPGGPWRGIVYKGHEDATLTEVNRTFAMWLLPDSNIVHYRISTTKDNNAGGNSNTQIAIDRWTHIAYVRRGDHLQLFLNGELDADVLLNDDEISRQAKVLPNSDDLIIGKSPYHAGINGALDDLRIYGLALTPDDVAELARSRTIPTEVEEPLVAYFRIAYEALLLGAGTSYEELRSLPPKGSADRLRIAERLGLLSLNGIDDDLDGLLLPNPSSTDLGIWLIWLSTTFDLPSTILDKILSEIGPSKGSLLRSRQDNLMQRWIREDSTLASIDQRPYLEPDLVDLEDIVPSHKVAVDILRTRVAELTAKWQLLRASAATNATIALEQVFNINEINLLTKIESGDAAGQPIEAYLKRFSLTFAAFRRIRRYQVLNAPMSERELDDFAHLLIGVWKLRYGYPRWLGEESVMTDPLWPTRNTEGAFVSGRYKRDFLPWRGRVSERIMIEQRIAARLRDWRTLLDSHDRAVLDAQRIALPMFRDRMLGVGDLPSAADYMDELTERLLVDVAASGATTLTLINQATLTLQSLVNGIRTQRFESGHPAFAWKIKTHWGSADDDINFTQFDEEWMWLGSYGTWRSAMMVYLYHENALYPELLTEASYPNHDAYPIYSAFLDSLHNLTLTSYVLTQLSKDYSTPSADDELAYFRPVLIGHALEKVGLFTLALDWYRKVFDPSKPNASRAKVAWLSKEVNTPPAPVFGDRWSLDLNPHTIASQRSGPDLGNPYTRFTINRIVSCMIALGDSEFARGTRDSREKALAFYLEAKQILGFDELDELPPTDARQALLPNPVFVALRMHVAVSLRKIRLGLNYIGAPMLADSTWETRGGQASTLLRTTLYPFKVLLERSRQLLAQAQNLEAQYFAALAQRDVEGEKLVREAGNAQIADETVSLRSLQETEATNGLRLANLQQERTQIERDRYQQWISEGPTQNEKTQIETLWNLSGFRNAINVLDTTITIGQHAESLTGVGVQSLGWWTWVIAAALDVQVSARAGVQHLANISEIQAQVSSILASQERRQQEWQLQLDLSTKNLDIGKQQITLAADRQAIAAQESRIATIQRDQVKEMVKFLSTKFTSREFYDWLQGVLAEIYNSFLRMATATAQQAEAQLAFQRQQTITSIIKQNYWVTASAGNATSSNQVTPDRRGITGSARLLQDIVILDQYAFDSEKRLLNLNQMFSLSRLFPIEFEEFRKTGLLNFATTLGMFDEGFPGHYMRLIKKVRISVIALIPPTLGIRATLSTGGLSRVVTGDMNFPTVVIRQDPQAIALSSPSASTGIFELDVQSDLLYPFEGMGVDANWIFELPPAGNPFDFDTLFDVLLTFEYTALNSSELRERTVKQLPSQLISDRSWSVRRDLPDVWYDLANQTTDILEVLIPLSKSDFPSYLSIISIEEILISVRMAEGKIGDFMVRPSTIKPSGEVILGVAAPAIQGVASSRQSGAANWHTTLLSDINRTHASVSSWRFELINATDKSFSLSQELKDGHVDDILIIMTFSGNKPTWTL